MYYNIAEIEEIIHIIFFKLHHILCLMYSFFQIYKRHGRYMLSEDVYTNVLTD